MCAAKKFLLIGIFWITLNNSIFSNALKDVHLTGPTVAKRGGNMILTCDYNLEGDDLYSVKWYRGDQEFLRFQPSVLPSIKNFPVPGINIDFSRSNGTKLVLTSLGQSASDTYNCEVTTEASYFSTHLASTTVDIVDLPHHGPEITFDDHSYRVGDVLEANCELRTNIRPSLVNLTWLINGQEWHTDNQKVHVTFDESASTFVFGRRVVDLKLVLKSFPTQNITLGCRAKVYDIYEETDERVIDMDYTTDYDLSETLPSSTFSIPLVIAVITIGLAILFVIICICVCRKMMRKKSAK